MKYNLKNGPSSKEFLEFIEETLRNIKKTEIQRVSTSDEDVLIIIKYVIPHTASLPHKYKMYLVEIFSLPKKVQYLSQLLEYTKALDTNAIIQENRKTSDANVSDIYKKFLLFFLQRGQYLSQVLTENFLCVKKDGKSPFGNSKNNFNKFEIKIFQSLYFGSKFYNLLSKMITIDDYLKILLKSFQKLDYTLGSGSKYLGEFFCDAIKLNPVHAMDIFFEHWIFLKAETFDNIFLDIFYKNCDILHKKILFKYIIKYLNKLNVQLYSDDYHGNIPNVIAYIIHKLNPEYGEFSAMINTDVNILIQYVYIRVLPPVWLKRLINYLFTQWNNNVEKKNDKDFNEEYDIRVSKLLIVALKCLNNDQISNEISVLPIFLNTVTHRLEHYHKGVIERTMCVAKLCTMNLLEYKSDFILDVPSYEIDFGFCSKDAVCDIDFEQLYETKNIDIRENSIGNNLEKKFQNMEITRVNRERAIIVDSDDEDEDEDELQDIVFVKDLLGYFLEHIKDGYVIEKLLRKSTELIRSKRNFVGEVNYYADELLETLVKLTNELEIKNFEQLRVNAIISVIDVVPDKILKLNEILLTEQELSLQQRMSILTAIGLSAMELSGVNAQNMVENKKAQGDLIVNNDDCVGDNDVVSLDNNNIIRGEGKVIWKSKKLETVNGKRAVVKNRFLTRTNKFFQPLANGWLNGIDMGTFDVIFKLQYLETLRIIVSLSTGSSGYEDIKEMMIIIMEDAVRQKLPVTF
ncbi:uncharacterized protein SCODWIG_01769 [Saccharomycodes ludwigii]|uniref:Telomere length regulation protein conserved domain-containing protein n=1 Tax=Saccharomycodes ludwigii TaxID=36035 RepID=A0A376B5P0_9ASCO|nr:hypothetical protein SCDLUD_002334 [Saccharomycodes ludwigii]KAH3900877.1 hypothetical protein SCDLUD_002334 [Saccharomycodes ludwigii]SSD60008.1 uncharacterized protein SCODWIG_01769 [Saccharomycodes ludwigii]